MTAISPSSVHAARTDDGIRASMSDTGEVLDQEQPPHLRWWTRNPLRVKLVAAMLALVSLALIAISLASTLFLNRYLLERVDEQLRSAANSPSIKSLHDAAMAGQDAQAYMLMPTDYFVAFDINPGSNELSTAKTPEIVQADLPVLGDRASLRARLGQPFTVDAADGKYRWRVLVTTVGGDLAVIGQNLATAEFAVDRLVVTEVLFGLSVLILLAIVGAWLVRQSLLPLAAIERTAAGIAKGDLSKRVPELDPRTELGQLSYALNTMLNQVESAFQARSASEARAVGSEARMRQFVADASHELRTPLTTIRGFAELYRQGAAPDPAQHLGRIEDEAARMGLLVEDLLLLARLDRERPMEYAPVHLAGIVADAAAAAHAVAPERTIEVDTAPGDSLVVAGDEARLRQVVGNLVTNALVHTPPATPITLRLRPEEDHAVIEIADRGPGLTVEQSEHVFERFYRVDKARTRRAVAPDMGQLASPHSGTGLGLAIVAALVAAHDGTVEVESTPGEGATFRVRLPISGSGRPDN